LILRERLELDYRLCTLTYTMNSIDSYSINRACVIPDRIKLRSNLGGNEKFYGRSGMLLVTSAPNLCHPVVVVEMI
jgi:hypothetical protein